MTDDCTSVGPAFWLVPGSLAAPLTAQLEATAADEGSSLQRGQQLEALQAQGLRVLGGRGGGEWGRMARRWREVKVVAKCFFLMISLHLNR